MVVGLAQPAPLARLLARSPACGFGTVFLAVAQARIAAEQLLATQASTSSGFDHGITGLQVPMEDPNDAENCAVGRRCVCLRGDSHRHFHPHRCQHGIVISIPAKVEKRSRSRWNPCSRSPGIGVHDAMETAFTIDRNMQRTGMPRGVGAVDFRVKALESARSTQAQAPFPIPATTRRDYQMPAASNPPRASETQNSRRVARIFPITGEMPPASSTLALYPSQTLWSYH